MADRSRGNVTLNLPSRDTITARTIGFALVALLIAVWVVDAIIGTLVVAWRTDPLRAAFDTFVLVYAGVWFATILAGPVGRYARRIHERVRAPYTRIETALLGWLGRISTRVDRYSRHIRVALGVVVAVIAFVIAAVLQSIVAGGVIMFGGGAWLLVYLVRALGRGSLNFLDRLGVDVVGTVTGTPSASDARDDPDHYALPMGIQATDGAPSRYRGGLLIPRTKSVGMIGATRSGKTEVAKHFVAQMQERRRRDEPVVVYDHKRDFQDTLAEWGVPTVRLSATESTATWNLFREIETERDLDELGRALFPSGSGNGSGSERGSSGAQFFDTAARQVFVAVAKYLRREYRAKDQDPTNALLVRYFERTDAETLYEDLTEYDDLVGAASAVDPEADRQARGVYATAQQRVNDVFVGDFATSADETDRPEISIRGYMKNPQDYVLVLDRPQRYGASVAPIFRFLVDRAAMHGLDEPGRGSYFVLDEFPRLPRLDRIEELVNVGAGQQTQVVLTLQSVSQLYDTYGRQQGQSILAGFATEILLRAGDGESVEHAREAIGTHFEEYTGHTRHRDLGDWGEREVERETQMEEEHPLSKGDLQRLDVGEAVIVQPGGWAFGYVPMIGGM